MARTLVVGRQYRANRIPFPAAEKIAEFVISCGVMIGALGVGLMTLCVTCCAGGVLGAIVPGPSSGNGLGDVGNGMLIALAWIYSVLALCAPVVTIVWFLWITRPRG